MGKCKCGQEEANGHAWYREEENTAATDVVNESEGEEGEKQVCGGDEHACGGRICKVEEGEDGGGEVHE